MLFLTLYTFFLGAWGTYSCNHDYKFRGYTLLLCCVVMISVIASVLNGQN